MKFILNIILHMFQSKFLIILIGFFREYETSYCFLLRVYFGFVYVADVDIVIVDITSHLFHIRFQNHILTHISRIRCIEILTKWNINPSLYLPSHLNPWRNRPYSIEPQWSQNVGDIKVWSRNLWGTSTLKRSLKYYH